MIGWTELDWKDILIHLIYFILRRFSSSILQFPYKVILNWIIIELDLIELWIIVCIKARSAADLEFY